MKENNVVLEIENDKYKLTVNGVELNKITNLYIDKQSTELTNITVTFNCKLETKTAFPKCKETQLNCICGDYVTITDKGIEIK